MDKCCDNGPGSGGADRPKAITRDMPHKGKRALLGANRGKGKNNVGRWKRGWTHDERKVLWECFVRSGGQRGGGYMKAVKALWDERGLGERSMPSLMSQLKSIENGLLSVMEREEIRKEIAGAPVGAGVGVAEWEALVGNSDDEQAGCGFQDGEWVTHPLATLGRLLFFFHTKQSSQKRFSDRKRLAHGCKFTIVLN